MELAMSKCRAAAIYLPENGQWERMLEPMLFAPAALWISKSLLWAGVESFWWFVRRTPWSPREAVSPRGRCLCRLRMKSCRSSGMILWNELGDG